MVTLTIVGITVIVSLLAFNNPNLKIQLLFNAYVIKNRKQFYRFFTSGLIHADFFHLFFNMYALYLFGSLVETVFVDLFPGYGRILYAILYISALPISSLTDYQKQQNNPRFNALGASGAVAAVIFCSIIMYPQQGIMIFPIPFFIPTYIFGPLYILYSYYMSKQNLDNIGHNAHLFGAIYGMLFIFLFWRDALSNFINQIGF